MKFFWSFSQKDFTKQVKFLLSGTTVSSPSNVKRIENLILFYFSFCIWFDRSTLANIYQLKTCWRKEKLSILKRNCSLRFLLNSLSYLNNYLLLGRRLFLARSWMCCICCENLTYRLNKLTQRWRKVSRTKFSKKWQFF